MSQQQTILSILERGRGMLRKHLDDVTDAEMLVRPVPSANHIAWQLSHLCNSTAGMLKAVVPGASVPMPEKLAHITKESAKSDDAALFPTKAELLTTIEALITALIDGIRDGKCADLDAAPAPPFSNFAANFAALALMVPLHQSMHIGQIQVIRRKLGKPVMF